jgi:hypothetical protein
VAGVIRGVKLVGRESLNGREYPLAVLKNAVGLYEGAKVNIDHPQAGQTNGRSVTDRIGVIRSAKFVEGQGIFGDFHFNPEHRLAKQLVWDAKNNPEAVGFSHVAMVRTAPSKNGKIAVEQIVQVKSVDLVADPATTKSLYESVETQRGTDDTHSEENEMDITKLTLEELKAARPDLFKAVEAETTATTEVELLKADFAKAQAELAGLKLAAAVAEEIKAAGLDATNKTHVSEVFQKQLLATESADDRKALLADRAALVKESKAPTKGPQSHPRGGAAEFSESRELSPAEFAASLRRPSFN